AQPHDGTCSSAVRPYCLRSKTWGSLRPHVHLCNNAVWMTRFTPNPCLEKPEPPQNHDVVTLVNVFAHPRSLLRKRRGIRLEEINKSPRK
ncbi:MAG: hypothetical protein VB125_04440, partial [Burkholderia sp.]